MYKIQFFHLLDKILYMSICFTVVISLYWHFQKRLKKISNLKAYIYEIRYFPLKVEFTISIIP